MLACGKTTQSNSSVNSRMSGFDETPIITNGPPPSLSKDTVLSAVEEAKDAPTLFQPRQRAHYVRERVKELRRLRALGQNDIQIKEAMGDFVEKYPELFKMAVEPNFNEQQFNLMTGLLDKMADGGMSQHQASVIVGQSLVDRYVTPMISGKGDASKKSN
jgi:hypothetical protein